MSFVTLSHTQDITHWERTDIPDGFGGFIYAAPVPLKARWEDKVDLITNSEGREIRSSARVFVGVDMKIDDYLIEGITTEADPVVAKARLIQDFRKIPGIAAEIFERRAFL